MTWKTALTKAINAEVAAEKAATVAEAEKRSTWWATTWALAAVPRAESGEAQALYAQRTNKPLKDAEKRRRIGSILTEETLVDEGLPVPSFAREAIDQYNKIKADNKVAVVLEQLAKAEKDGMSLREFRQALTGRPFTNAPENMTEADEDAVVEKVARTRPATVARQAAKPQVAAKIVDDKKATKEVIQQQSARTHRIIKRRKEEAAANPTAAAETTGAVDASQGMNGMFTNSADYNSVNRHLGQMISAWLNGVREQSLTPLDRHHLGADLPALRRIEEEITAFVEADDDPYAAVMQVRAERDEQFQREMDAAEGDTDIDTGLNEIERFANEGN